MILIPEAEIAREIDAVNGYTGVQSNVINNNLATLGYAVTAATRIQPQKP